MGPCLSSRSSNSSKSGNMTSRSVDRRKNFRAADSLYVADLRKQKNKGKQIAKQLKILHFNDSYNIEPGQSGNGGAGKFVQALNHFQEYGKNDGEFEVLTLFSGDLLAPSTLSTMFHGEQMVVPFNRMDVDVACIGNHDLDFGVTQMMKCLEQTMHPHGKCEWIISNLVEKGKADEHKTIGGLKRYTVVDRCGIKIGIIGIAEKQWIDTFKELEVEVEYLNYKRYRQEYLEISNQKRQAEEIARKLREEHDCQLIIALTHMRLHHDAKFATECPAIDIVLGGHDHFYKSTAITQKIKREEWRPASQEQKIVPLIKSGTDFQEFSEINITFDTDQAVFMDVIDKVQQDDPSFIKVNDRVYTKSLESDKTEDNALLMHSEENQLMIHSSRIQLKNLNFPPAQDIVEHEQEYLKKFDKSLSGHIGWIATDFDLRDAYIRTQESVFGNFISDLMRTEFGCDVAIINSGSIRSGELIPSGPISTRTIVKIFPFPDTCSQLKVTGAVLLKAINHGLSQYPEHDGRFPTISGMKIKFDPDKPKEERITEVIIDNRGPLQESETYTLVITSFMSNGGDGYKMFKEEGVTRLSEADNGLWIIDLVKQFFTRTSTSYEMVESRKARREMRFKMFGMDETNGDCISPDGKWVMVNSEINGRIQKE